MIKLLKTDAKSVGKQTLGKYLSFVQEQRRIIPAKSTKPASQSIRDTLTISLR